jgi:hypothetical protein
MSITQSATQTQKHAARPSGAANGGLAFKDIKASKLIDLINQALDGLNTQGEAVRIVRAPNGAWVCELDKQPAPTEAVVSGI